MKAARLRSQHPHWSEERGDTEVLKVLLNTKANQITYAYGSVIKSDSLYNLCFPVQVAPTAVCQNGVMDFVLHPIEPLAIRLTLAGAF